MVPNQLHKPMAAAVQTWQVALRRGANANIKYHIKLVNAG
jgi:hypothetical protein